MFLYKTSTYYLQEKLDDPRDRESWIQHNAYFGYAVSVVSFTAILQLLFTELWKSLTDRYQMQLIVCPSPKNRKVFLQEFGISHGYLWSFSLIACFVIILAGEDCEHFV